MEQLTLFATSLIFSPRLVSMGCHDRSRRSRETNCAWKVSAKKRRAPRGEERKRKENEGWEGRGRFGTALKIGRSFLDARSIFLLGLATSSYFAFPGVFVQSFAYCVICSHLVHPFLFRLLSEYVFTNSVFFLPFLFFFSCGIDFGSEFFLPDVRMSYFFFLFFLIKLRSSWVSRFNETLCVESKIRSWLIFRNERCVTDF